MIQLTGAGNASAPKYSLKTSTGWSRPTSAPASWAPTAPARSTLLKVLAGIEGLDYGSITVRRASRVGYLPQEGLSLSGRTRLRRVHDRVRRPARHGSRSRKQLAQPHGANSIPPAPSTRQVADRFHRVETEFRARDGYALEAQVGTVLSGLGFPQRDWHRRTEEFSGGWQMRIALAKLLLEKPNLLLLDEPTNHLDLEARNWLEEYLADYPHAFVLVSHDRYFLDVTVRKIVEMWNKGVHFYTGGYDTLRAAERPSGARSSKPPTRTSRTASSSSKPSSTASATRPPRPSRCRAASRNWRGSSASRSRPKRRPSTSSFPQPKPSGRIVAEFQNVAKSYGDQAGLRAA